MFRHLSVHRFLKATRARFLKQCSILKELKFCRQVSTIQPEYGMFRQAKCFRFCRAIRIRYFHANSTMKEIPLSQAQRITLAASGETHSLAKSPK